MFLLSDDIAYWGLIYETSPVGIYDGIVGIFNKSIFILFLYFRFFFGFVGGGANSFLIIIEIPFEGLIFISLFLAILLYIYLDNNISSKLYSNL